MSGMNTAKLLYKIVPTYACRLRRTQSMVVIQEKILKVFSVKLSHMTPFG